MTVTAPQILTAPTEPAPPPVPPAPTVTLLCHRCSHAYKTTTIGRTLCENCVHGGAVRIPDGGI